MLNVTVDSRYNNTEYLVRYHRCTQYIVVFDFRYILRAIYKYIFNILRDGRCARCLVCYTAVINDSIDRLKCCINRNLPKVFLYLLSMIIIYYNYITLIYDVYYTESSLSLSYLQTLVSEQPT